MNIFSRLMVLSVIMLCCVCFDQYSKSVAQHHLQGHASISFLDGLIYFVYAENSGTMLGIGSGLPERVRFVLFVLFVGMIIAVAIAFVVAKQLRTMTLFAISFLVGGGVGNLIDRIIHNGSVIDFILLKVGSLESGIFNVADLAITIGVGLLCISILSQNRRRYKIEN